MLLRFACSNFRSIKDRQEISFVAAPAYKEHADSLFTFDGVKHSVLPVAAIYGANASGKTNVLTALDFMLECIGVSQANWKTSQIIPRKPFRLDTVTVHQSSVFEIDFLFSGILYEYGFECTSSHFIREWLYSYSKGRRSALFERANDNSVKYGRGLRGKNAIVSQIIEPNTLVLSAGLVTRHESLAKIAIHLILGIKNYGPDMGPGNTVMWAALGSCVDAATALIREADTGVSNVEIKEETARNATRHKPTPPDVNVLLYHPDQFGPEMVERATELSEKDLSVEFLHKRNDGELIRFDPSDESRGTLRLFELAGPIQRALRLGQTVLIDELDSSLHTHLAQALIRLFTDRTTNPKGAQLLFTTHDTNLLNTDLLRRDEIWFTEKGPDGATVLYPLSDIRVRATDNLAKGYLDGRFGAIPFIGNLERLVGKDC